MIGHSSTFRVDIVTKDLGILRPEETGLPCAVQAARVVVTLDGDSRSHTVVRAAEPPWRLPTDDGPIRALFPNDFVSCVRGDSPGRADVSLGAGSEAEVHGAVSAVATLQRAWSWDESPVIAVHVVGVRLPVIVDPRFEQDSWTVAIAT
jgi:hypothetical protein